MATKPPPSVKMGEALPSGAVCRNMHARSEHVPGYIDNAEAIGNGLCDGWLATGDLGSIDADGFLSIVGRTKEVINRGGEKISPHEVEAALLLHPAVREAAAFSVPHPRLGENVAAAIVLPSH
jgi:oxalate---CoA ligase